MTDLSAEYQALAQYRPKHKVRFVTAASLFWDTMRVFSLEKKSQ